MWSTSRFVERFSVLTPLLTSKIILASGKLVNANATSSPDLFRALKGGWNNFGIVTRFDLKPFAQGEILAGAITSSISDRDAVFKAFSDIADAKEYDPYASLVTGLGYNSSVKGSWSIATTAAYTKPELHPPVFDSLLAIPGTKNTLALTNLSTLSNEPNTPPLYVAVIFLNSISSTFRRLTNKSSWAFSTGTYGVSAALMSKIFDSLNSTIYNFELLNSWVFWSIAFEPLPTVISQDGHEHGGNSLGTSPKDGNGFGMFPSCFPLWLDRG